MSYYSSVPMGVGVAPTAYMTPGYGTGYNIGAYQQNPCMSCSPCCAPMGTCYPLAECCGICTGLACCLYCCR